jgi:hypothetical protein
MRLERAIDLIARLALSWGETDDDLPAILHPLGKANIERIEERMREIREDLRPDNARKNQAWNLLLEDGKTR